VRDVNWVALIVFVWIFCLITWLGFAAGRWREGNLDLLHEWGLGGRRFGTLVNWFLLGGALYTAYTSIAVPALAFGAGAIAFFAVPYTMLIYPIVFTVFPRFWRVSHKRGYITAADFVRGRFGNRWLALAIAGTGILATVPYIALQLVGLQVVIGALGIWGEGWIASLPVVIAFAILASFTYSSGLRAPAAIVVVKDVLILVTVFACIVVIPFKLGGYANIFAAVPANKLLLPVPQGNTTGAYSNYATLALGSALALFLYPHATTAILSASSPHSIRRNAVMLPAYSFMLGLLALVGFMAIAAGVDKLPQFEDGFLRFKSNFAVPALMLHMFPSWFVGAAFAAIGIGALVPAAIMSIAAANLFARNIYREFWQPQCTHQQECQVAKWASLNIKLGALLFIILVPEQYSIQLQLLGGIWIIQTLPSVIIGLYTRWLNPWALLTGWAAGMIIGTEIAASLNFVSTYSLVVGSYSFPGYTALYMLILNLLIAIVLTLVFNMFPMRGVRDETMTSDYHS
jgi:SSS family solute:Na+ symporter